jgi:PAS domain S-box-containing protein
MAGLEEIPVHSSCDHQFFFLANDHGIVVSQSRAQDDSPALFKQGELWYREFREASQLELEWNTFRTLQRQFFRANVTHNDVQSISGPITWIVTVQRLLAGEQEQLVGSLIPSLLPSSERQIRQILDRLAETTNPSSWGHWLYSPENETIVLGEGWRNALDHFVLDNELSLDSFLEMAHQEDAAPFRENLFACVSGNSCHFEQDVRFRCERGIYRWTNCWGFVLQRSSKGKATRILGFSADSNKIRFQREFLSSGATLLEHVQESVIATDLGGIIWFWGKGAEKLYGWRSDEVLGRPVHLIVPVGREEIESQRMREVYKKGSWYGRYEQIKKCGRRFNAESYIALIRNNQGDPLGFVGIDHDITESVESQRQIANLQAKLSNVGWMNVRGEILAGISHEINQPLYAIQNFASAAKKHLERGDNMRCGGLLEKVCREVDRADRISESMREFARKSELQLTAKCIHEVIEICSPFANLYAESLGVNLRIDLEAAESVVKCDELHLQQAILNLVRNACESLLNHDVAQTPSVIVSTWNNSQSLFIDIEDNGCGIPKVHQTQIFDHFFSTKAQGTGVGLPLCKSVVKLHGGELQLARTSESGTVFRIGLPLHQV